MGLQAIDVIEAARAAYRAEQIDRTEAVERIRLVVNVTEVGAGDLLDDDRSPSSRYATGRRS